MLAVPTQTNNGISKSILQTIITETGYNIKEVSEAPQFYCHPMHCWYLELSEDFIRLEIDEDIDYDHQIPLSDPNAIQIVIDLLKEQKARWERVLLPLISTHVQRNNKCMS